MNAHRSFKERVFKNGLWTLLGKLVAILGAFALNVVLTRALSPEDYGAYFIAVNTIVILASVGTLGMDQVVVRFAAISRSKGLHGDTYAVIRSCLAIVTVATLLLCGPLVFALPEVFRKFVVMPSLARLSPLILLWLFCATLQRQLAETFRGLHDIKFATVFGGLRNNGILISAVTLLMSLVLWATGMLTLSSVVGASALGSLLVVLAAFFTLRHKVARPQIFSDVPSSISATLPVRKMLREGWPLWIAILVMVGRQQGTAWLAGAFDTSAHVALFGAAQRFVGLLTAPLVIVNALLPPIIAQLYEQSELKRLQRIVQAMGGMVALPSAAALVLLLLCGEQIIGALFGAYYRNAYPLLILLCMGQIANIVTGAWQIVLPMTGHKRLTLFVSATAAAIQLASGIIGGMLAGVYGVAWGYCIGVIANNVIGVLVVRRYIGIWTLASFRWALIRETMEMVLQRLGGGRKVEHPQS